MTQDDFRLMLEMMADSWTNREYGMVTECFAQNLFYSDSLNYSFTNKDELLRFFENDDGMPQKCVFHRSVFDERGQIGAAEYTYSGTNQFHGTVWLKLVGDRIVDWREYQHTSGQTWEEFWKRT
jgi:hypothetical protein